MDAEIWSRLAEGGPLDGLGLGFRNGRLDLRGLTAPEPTAGKTTHTTIADVVRQEGLIRMEGLTLQSLDLSASSLNHLLFVDCRIENCVFDKSKCQNWGLWGTSVSNSTFYSADLRNSALGAVLDDKRNAFGQVDFTKADLRGTVYTAAEFIGCKFRDTRLDKVDFQTSTFTNCCFEGELREVCFYRRGFRGEIFPANEMVGVDFTRAQLRHVEFRGLDLDNVALPTDCDHIVLNEFPKTLDRLLEVFVGRADVGSRRLVAYLGICRKWAGARGVLNKNDIRETGGEEGLDMVLKVLGNPAGNR